jgi:hypothetical protein
LNTYAYVSGNPVNYVGFFGLKWTQLGSFTIPNLFAHEVGRKKIGESWDIHVNLSPQAGVKLLPIVGSIITPASAG